jgi:hypothetical protein
MSIASVTACNKRAEVEAEIGGDAASVVAVEGPGHLHRIKLSSDAAQRIGLETAVVRLLPPLGRPRMAVPMAAVLYDQNGATWVYAQVAPLTFQRARVVLTAVGGNFAILRSGPPAGTAVATVGAAELRGSEDGVPGE